MAKTIVSFRGELIPEDVKKILSGLGIALVGAALTYFSQFVTQTNFGEWTPLVTAVWAVIFNAVRKYFQITEYKK